MLFFLLLLAKTERKGRKEAMKALGSFLVAEEGRAGSRAFSSGRESNTKTWYTLVPEPDPD
jgi:hypothetical protein